jgi:hypothetical protein
MANPFLDIDPDDKVPENLKKALVSEIDTIRGSMELVTLYVGYFFNAMGEMFTDNPSKAADTQTKN